MSNPASSRFLLSAMTKGVWGFVHINDAAAATAAILRCAPSPTTPEALMPDRVRLALVPISLSPGELERFCRL